MSSSCHDGMFDSFLDRYVEAEPVWAKQLEGEMTLGRKRIVFRCPVIRQPRFDRFRPIFEYHIYNSRICVGQ